MIYLFWGALAFLVYTMFGYPLLLWVLARFHKQEHRRAPTWPKVSLIVVAHNEAKTIAGKVRNCLELEYPEGKWEIIVASDGSNDGTADIVRSFAGNAVKLVEVQERRGKHYAQMVARDASSGEILVFSDAGVRLEPKVLGRMVSNFADPQVGCVSSEDVLVMGDKDERAEGSYVQLDALLRRWESRVSSLVSVSGAFFAARREVCGVWHPEQSSDFFVPLHTVAQGLRAVVDSECHGQYGHTTSDKAELWRKVRTIAHGLDVFFKHLELLNPVRYGFFSLQLLSHKLFRWLMPFAALVLVASNVFLWTSGQLYQLCLVGQAVLYGLGTLGLVIRPLQEFKLVKMAAFFLMGNVGTLMAWLSYCAGEKFVTWQPTQRN